MVKILTDALLRYRLKKKFKKAISQPKERIKSFKTMAVLISESSNLDEKMFQALAEQLKISAQKITFVIFSKKEIVDQTQGFGNRIFCSRNKLTLSGEFPEVMNDFFKLDFDLLINYFSDKSVFPELLSMNCSSKLRIGFSAANHKINDIILDIDPKQTDLFLAESTNYLNAFLK
ncbi:MAG: hypothetical protein ABGW63_05275 [Flavobacteriaceae bacterium]